MKLKVVGVLAYDSIISEFGKKENLFGGSATHFAISASYLNKNVHVTGAIGNDFDLNDQLDPVLTFKRENGKFYPYDLRHNLIDQMKPLKKVFPDSKI